MSVIDVKNVTKRYGDFTAVDQVSFSVPKGKIYGILGPNGAGKTSTIRMINSITMPDEGSIYIQGMPVSDETQKLIGYLPEERGLYKKMKVAEQLIYLARLKGMSQIAAIESVRYWLERFEALDWINKEIGELSKGMQQKIQFISTIAHNPEIYVFDEPFSGLDPINSELLKQVILELREQGKTIIFCTHRMEQVEQMCDYICLYNKGKKILDGSLAEIKQSFGKNTLHLEFDGDPSFAKEIENVRLNNHSNRFVEMRLMEGADPQQILRDTIDKVHITKFEMIYPSLHEIFISSVGTANANSVEA